MTMSARISRAAVAAALLSVSLVGCIGADTPVGGVGVYLDDAGSVTVLVEPCGEDVEGIEMNRLDESDVEAVDPVVGSWVARSPDDPDLLTVESPAVGWEVDLDPGPLADGDLYGVDASYADDDVMGAGTTTFRPSDLRALEEGDVIAADEQAMTRSEFDEWACR